MNKITKIAVTIGSTVVLLSITGSSVFAQTTQTSSPNSLTASNMMMNEGSNMVSSFAPSNTQATVMWPSVAGAVSYNIYYKESSAANWTHSVPAIPEDAVQYTINDLGSGTSYQYMVTAVDNTGMEFWTSGVKTLR